MKISCEITGQKSWSSWSNPRLFVGQFEINEIITLENNRELVGPAGPGLNAPWAKQPAPLTGSRLAEPLAARTTRRVFLGLLSGLDLRPRDRRRFLALRQPTRASLNQPQNQLRA